MITDQGTCVWVLDAMIREVRPTWHNGGAWRAIEPTGELWFYCHTHAVEEYGPKADVLAAAAAHCPEIAAPMAR